MNMKATFIYNLNSNDKIKVTVEKAEYTNNDLERAEYSGVLTGEVLGIEDNIEYNGMSGIYIEYEENISSKPKVLYLHHTEILSVKKIGTS